MSTPVASCLVAGAATASSARRALSGVVNVQPRYSKVVAPTERFVLKGVQGRASAALCAHASGSDASGASPGGFSYRGVVFDMDGTLTVSNIDFKRMRELVEIPQGDLFTTMEAWEDPGRIAKAMETILDLEKEALSTLQAMPGLTELLRYLKAQKDVKVAVVTRNTPTSVNAFLNLLDEDLRDCFDAIITRHHRHVKPDYRLLCDLADDWRLDVRDMLMVGDSTEDVECGNAAGTATCLIKGGGNEVGGSVQPPPGAIPTFTVESLHDLLSRIDQGHVSPGLGRPQTPEAFEVGFRWEDLAPGASATESMDSGSVPDSGLAGSPPPGVDFLDDMYERGFLSPAESSFPRMGNAAGGMKGSKTRGDRVLHVGAGTGALTKLMASQGLECIAIDTDPTPCVSRGLQAVAFAGDNLTKGSCAPALAVGPEGGGPFDAVVVYQGGVQGREKEDAGDALVESLVRGDGLQEVAGVLRQGGRLCLQAVMRTEDKWALMRSLWESSMTVVYSARLKVPGGAPGHDRILRLVAVLPKLGEKADDE